MTAYGVKESEYLVGDHVKTMVPIEQRSGIQECSDGEFIVADGTYHNNDWPNDGIRMIVSTKLNTVVTIGNDQMDVSFKGQILPTNAYRGREFKLTHKGDHVTVDLPKGRVTFRHLVQPRRG